MNTKNNFLAALSHTKRLNICKMLLAHDRVTVNTIAESNKLPQAVASQHLLVLENSGIVAKERAGTIMWCFINPNYRNNLEGVIRSIPKN